MPSQFDDPESPFYMPKALQEEFFLGGRSDGEDPSDEIPGGEESDSIPADEFDQDAEDDYNQDDDNQDDDNQDDADWWKDP